MRAAVLAIRLRVVDRAVLGRGQRLGGGAVRCRRGAVCAHECPADPDGTVHHCRRVVEM